MTAKTKTDGTVAATPEATNSQSRMGESTHFQGAANAEPLPDEFHGQGGSYVIVDGVRKLVSRTKNREEAEAEEKAQAAAAQRSDLASSAS